MPKEHLFLLVIQTRILSAQIFLEHQCNCVRQFICTYNWQPSADWPICCCYANVRKSVGTIKIWLRISFVREAECDTHLISTLHTHCSSAGDRAHRKLWEEVLFWWTRQTILSCRDLWDCVENQQENKARKQEEKLVSPLLLTLLKAVCVKALWATWRGQVWGGLLLHNSSRAARVSRQQVITAQPRPCINLNFEKTIWSISGQSWA